MVGSGILLKFREYRFLLSAAHVFDEMGNSLSFPEIGIEAPVAVEVTTSGLPTSGRKDDVIDVGIARLPEDVALLLERRFKFISIENIDTNDRYEDSKKYCFTGFPATQSRVRYPARAIDIDCYEYRLDAYEISNESQPWHPSLHLAGYFERENMRHLGGVRITAPEPQGISGGGVWTYDETRGYKLVGIGTNWDVNYNILVGVRIGAWMCFIRQKYPELIAYFPSDPRIAIRFES